MARSHIQELLEQVDFEAFLDQMNIEYRENQGSSGRQFNIKTCPWCDGDNWKVFANAETGLGNCFRGSCGKTFNLYSFFAQTNGVSEHRDIIAGLKHYANTQIWRPASASLPDTFKSDLQLPANVSAVDNEYLKSRGVSPAAIKEFDIRYCESGFYSYYLNGEIRSTDYSNRVLFPIMDISGKMASFQGRTVINATPPYLFPSGYASTASLLYHANKAIGKDSVVIAEGVMDVIAIWQALKTDTALGQFAAVGSFGKELSSRGNDDQVSALLFLKKMGLKTVYMYWDPELDAAKKAIKAAINLLKFGLKVKLCFGPPNTDPGESTNKQIVDSIMKASNVSAVSEFALIKKVTKIYA